MLSRSVVLNALGQAASLALGFAASVVLARWLGPADRGVLAIMLSVTALGYILAAGGLPTAVEYYASRKEVRSGSLLGNTLLYGLGLALVLVPVFWFARGPIADLVAKGHGGDAWVLVGVLVALDFVQWTCGNQLSGMLRFGLYNALFSLSRFVYVVAVLLLLTLASLGVTAGLLAAVIGALVMTGGSLTYLLRVDRPRLDRPLMRRMLSYGARNQVGLVFQSLNYRLDVVILQFFRPLREVGYYVIAQVVAELTLTLANSFQGVLALVSREEQEGRSSETTTASVRHHGVLAACTLLATAAGGPVLIAYAFGHEFHSAIVPMLLLLPGIWFLGTGRVVSVNLAGLGRPGLPSTFAGVAAVVTVGLDLALIPTLGIYGAVIASICAYTTYGLGSLIALSRVSGISVRGLLLPTRADLRVYPAAAGRLLAAARR
jgi:O-antigen/teichoic acid export membrane protein